jgi:hypothetical protein
MADYTFEDWMNGEPEPEKIKNRDVEDSIRYNQRQAFEAALEIDLRSKKRFLSEDFLDKMEKFDRNEILNLEIQKVQEYYDSLGLNKTLIILKDFSAEGLTAKMCPWMERGLKSELGCDLSFLNKNLIFQGRSTYQYLKYLKSMMAKYSLKDIELRNKKPQPKKTANKDIPLKTLKQLFYEKFKSDTKYQELKEILFKKGVLSDDRSTWIGTGENGVTQLASTIKYIGTEYFSKKFQNKHVIFISENDFKISFSIDTAKQAKAEDGQYYFY